MQLRYLTSRTHRTTLAVTVLILCSLARFATAGPAGDAVRQGNRLFAQDKFTQAIERYDQALVEQPSAIEPRFNKANSYYRLDDLAKAIDLYADVAAGSKDMAMVGKAKYNLGNCHFQRGLKQRDSDLNKALEDMEASIGHWRQVLKTQPKNAKAARNIEVARLMIKDILDQLKNQQQQDPNQPNQHQGQNQQQQQPSQEGRQDPNQPQQAQGQDPNQPQESQRANQNSQEDEPDESQDKQPGQAQTQDQQEQEAVAPDMTAQEILDNEQRRKKQRQMLRRGAYQKVDKDW